MRELFRGTEIFHILNAVMLTYMLVCACQNKSNYPLKNGFSVNLTQKSLYYLEQELN